MDMGTWWPSSMQRLEEILRNQRVKRQKRAEAFSDGDTVFLSTAEGERIKVRGIVRVLISQIYARNPLLTSHPDPLPFRRGEETQRRGFLIAAHFLVRFQALPKAGKWGSGKVGFALSHFLTCSPA